METELTKKIKRACHTYKPALNTTLRTIRYADEVLCPNGGYVDSIRFEDYIAENRSYCLLENPEKAQNGTQHIIENIPKHCKLGEEYRYYNPYCYGCVWKHTEHILDMLVTCYEIKISVSDFKSKNGHNFYGNHNYYVVSSDIYNEIKHLVPDDIGIIVYYKDSGTMRTMKKCKFRNISDEDKAFLLYNALKKWCDGTQC